MESTVITFTARLTHQLGVPLRSLIQFPASLITLQQSGENINSKMWQTRLSPLNSLCPRAGKQYTGKWKMMATGWIINDV